VVSVLTTIGHDHMHILGHTLAEIAGEKAGIIKEGTPVVCAPQEPAAMAVIERVSREKHAPFHAVSQLWRWRGTHHTLLCQEFTASRRSDDAAKGPREVYRDLCLPLLGTHQLRNAAVVLETVTLLRILGIELDEAAVRRGMRQVRWPGRFELLGSDPHFVVDGAHNVDSARVLSRAIRDYFPGLRPWFVLGILSDKDIPAILKQLLPIGQGAFMASSGHPRAADPHELQRLAAKYDRPTWICDSIGEATRRAIGRAGRDGLVVATGSFTTAGAAREAWLRLHNRPLPAIDSPL